MPVGGDPPRECRPSYREVSEAVLRRGRSVPERGTGKTYVDSRCGSASGASTYDVVSTRAISGGHVRR